MGIQNKVKELEKSIETLISVLNKTVIYESLEDLAINATDTTIMAIDYLSSILLVISNPEVFKNDMDRLSIEIMEHRITIEDLNKMIKDYEK